LISLIKEKCKYFAVRLACGRVLEECLSLNNREYIVNKGYLKKLVATAMKLSKNPEQQRMSLSIMESLFKHSTATSYRFTCLHNFFHFLHS
uniref:RICTOR_M domain-containing protein n=1 Tax=Ascaris lumbricoides TaxID=6252 RepID=A0A0M3HJW8_ASCLU